MKKVIISAIFILSFGAYALYQSASGQSPSVADTTSLPTVSVPTTSKSRSKYNDGIYVGNSVDAYYGMVQVKATIAGGKITDVTFLSYPSDRSTSRFISSNSIPVLTSEALKAQSANVNIVSGATDTSRAFKQSLASALSQA